jgi:hypothetical protein
MNFDAVELSIASIDYFTILDLMFCLECTDFWTTLSIMFCVNHFACHPQVRLDVKQAMQIMELDFVVSFSLLESVIPPWFRDMRRYTRGMLAAGILPPHFRTSRFKAVLTLITIATHRPSRTGAQSICWTSNWSFEKQF